MTDIYVIKSDPDVFKFQNAITITGVHFVDIQSSVVMGRFIVAEAIREQLYNTGAMGVFTTVKNINVTKPFWQYLCNKLQPLTINGYVSQTTTIDHRVKRIEHAFGIHKESIKLNLQVLKFQHLKDVLNDLIEIFGKSFYYLRLCLVLI